MTKRALVIDDHPITHLGASRLLRDLGYDPVGQAMSGEEALAQELMETLRCLTCQSQSIADSDAPMAGDMRHQVRIRIVAGESPEEIRSWLMQRYGDYVSYRPEVSATTWPLFAVPVLILIAALAIFRRRFARRA